MVYVAEKAEVESKSIATVIQHFSLRLSVILSVALKGIDVFQMQDGRGSPYGKLTDGKQRRMHQTIRQKRTDDQYEKWQASREKCCGRKEEGKEGARTANRACGEIDTESLLMVSLAVTLGKVRRRAGSAATDEFANLLHQQKFNLSVFKQRIKTSRDAKLSRKM